MVQFPRTDMCRRAPTDQLSEQVMHRGMMALLAEGLTRGMAGMVDRRTTTHT